MNSDQTTIKVIKQVYVHLSTRRRRQLLLLCLLMIISSFVEALSISAILPFLGALATPEKIWQVDALQPVAKYFKTQDVSELRFKFTAIFISLVLLSGLLRILYFWLQARLSMVIGVDFSSLVYEKTLYQPYGELINKNSSEILAGAQKARDLVGYIIQPTLIIISSSFMLLAVLGALLMIEPSVAIYGFFGFGLLYIFAVTLSKKMLQDNSRVYATELGRVNKAIQEGIGGIRDIIIDGSQAAYINYYRVAVTRMQNAAALNAILAQLPRFVIEMIGVIFLSVIALWMTIKDENFADNVPIFGVVALCAQRLLPILQQCYAAYVSIKGGFSSTFDVLQLLDQKNCTQQMTVTSEQIKFCKLIKIRNLVFKYSNNSPTILKSINFDIKQGDRIGFIGSTGSGKSTIVDLIMGLLRPTSGEIYIDEFLLSHENMKQWNRYISHVPQSIFLADATIAENIAFGIDAKDIDMERVRDAARVAQIAHTINSFAEGYETYVGERGIRLSGGQRQRIGLARAIYKRSKLLVLDEATSALDVDTELAVMDALDALDKNVTIIIIAHRLSTLKNCNLIIELDNGNVVWSGTYIELLERKQV